MTSCTGSPPTDEPNLVGTKEKTIDFWDSAKLPWELKAHSGEMDLPPQLEAVLLRKARRVHSKISISKVSTASGCDSQILHRKLLADLHILARRPNDATIIPKDFHHSEPAIDIKTGERNSLPNTNYIVTNEGASGATPNHGEKEDSTSDSSSDSSSIEEDSELRDFTKKLQLHPIKIGVEQIRQLQSGTTAEKKEQKQKAFKRKATTDVQKDNPEAGASSSKSTKRGGRAPLRQPEFTSHDFTFM